MRFLLPLLAAILILTYSTPAPAEDYLLYGLGIANSAKYEQVETKVIGIGYRDQTILGLTQQVELGHFSDSTQLDGRLSSWWAGYSLGIEVQSPTGLVLRLMIGPSLISTPDAYLGGYFQFNNDAFAGLRDESGKSIGVSYKHLSSAGLESPNVGRDFLLFQVAVPW